MRVLRVTGWLFIVGAALGGLLVGGLWADGSLRATAEREADQSIQAMPNPSAWEGERPKVIAGYLRKHISLGAAYSLTPLTLGAALVVAARRQVQTLTRQTA